MYAKETTVGLRLGYLRGRGKGNRNAMSYYRLFLCTFQLISSSVYIFYYETTGPYLWAYVELLGKVCKCSI